MANPFRESAVKGIGKGDSFSYKRVFTQKDTIVFGDPTRDYNPVHYDSRWASAKRPLKPDDPGGGHYQQTECRTVPPLTNSPV